MESDILRVLGGVGLFLFGMVVLTDGLRRLAGHALRQALARFTTSPVTGAATGALTTAVIQSSSATTVTAIGFVGAGLLTFPQALGIVLGANVGTTVTGWLVALVGFKLKIGVAVLPLVLVGVLMTIFGRNRLNHAGWALAGFGMLFLGIDAIQGGMARFEGLVTPADFPSPDLFGRLQLVLIGIAVTIVTQSSSAGVATALVALGAGAITFDQAAALVIGMDVGTTSTAALATVGGSTATRRTGYAHVIFNLMIGTGAFFLLGPVADAVRGWVAADGAGNAQIAVVAFHTAMNLVGVLLVLPVAGPFARLVMRLVPERGPPLIHRLDDRVLHDPAAAVDALAATIRDLAFALFGHLAHALNPAWRGQVPTVTLRRLADDLEATRGFAERIRTDQRLPRALRRHVAAMHALDHLHRLLHRLGQTERIVATGGDARLRRLADVTRRVVAALTPDGDPKRADRRLDRLRRLLRDQRRGFRERTLVLAAEQRLDAETAVLRLDSIRWLHRAAYHVWRIVHHLRLAEEQAAPEPAAPAVETEAEED
ncbi:MAG: Na/Pi symporter [Alphaproteobacteria bacterium]